MIDFSACAPEVPRVKPDQRARCTAFIQKSSTEAVSREINIMFFVVLLEIE